VVVVAPDREQSAVGTSVTLHVPLRTRAVNPLVKGVQAYSVEGTPGDSVILALGKLLRRKVDLVVSGINEGANLGNDVIISGTVGAAFQGYFHGVPAMAISVTAIEKVRFEVAARLGGMLARAFAEGALPEHFLLNVNLPNVSLGEIKGIEVTRLGGRSYADKIKEGHDGKRRYFWIVRGKAQWNMEEGTDVWAIHNNRISITPLGSDLTSPSGRGPLEKLCPLLFQNLSSAQGSKS
jgi:5'-nucleotidase